MILPKEVIYHIFEEAQSKIPEESCGVLVGRGDKVTSHFSITNACHGEHRYAFDPEDQYRAVKEAKQEGLEIIAIYFTHAHTAATPTPAEIKQAYSKDLGHVIFALSDELQDVRAYTIMDGVVNEESIQVV